jgi:hypothetical protein
MALQLKQACVAGGADYSKIKNMHATLSGNVKFGRSDPRFPLPAAGH